MGIVAITRPAASASARQPMMTFIGDGGSQFSVPYAPLPVTYKGGMGWENVARSGRGRTALLLEGNPALKTLDFALTLAKPDNQDDIEDWLNALRAAADGTERWTVSYGPQEAGLWRFTNYSQDVEQRQRLTNLATRATVTITLTEAGQPPSILPTKYTAPTPTPPKTTKPAATAPAKPAKPSSGTSADASPSVQAFYKSLATNPQAAFYFLVTSQLAQQAKKNPSRPATITVRAGDTLTGLAVKWYGDSKFFALIAGMNGITNTTLQLKPGTVLKLYNPS